MSTFPRSANRLLGHPDDARLLLVNADDFGMYAAINAGVADAFARGIVRSTSIMMPCPGAKEAAAWLREHPLVSFSVHFSIVHDIPTYRWDPVAPRERIPSMLDEEGHFYLTDRMEEMLAKVDVSEVEIEFRAQLEAALAEEITPTHLDWHCLHDGGRADIFDLTYGLAREYGLALRTGPHPGDRRFASLPTADYDLLDSFALPLDTKASEYERLLQQLPAGLSEWAVHPALDTREARTIDTGGLPVRISDHAFLVSDDARHIIAEEGILLVEYAELQALWRAQKSS